MHESRAIKVSLIAIYSNNHKSIQIVVIPLFGLFTSVYSPKTYNKLQFAPSVQVYTKRLPPLYCVLQFPARGVAVSCYLRSHSTSN